MSEYQYYEFLAIDRPLTAKQMEEVRRFSTRAEITSTRFVNEYHFGSFRGNPLELLEKYYDVMASKQTKTYEQAIHLLKDLHDLAAKAGSLATFRSRVSALREAHAKKPNFIKQLKRSGLADEAPNAIG